MILLLAKLILGFLLLTKGADWLTRAIVWIAELGRIPRLVVGATLIGFATNIPEFVVTLKASWRGHGELALATPIGSNIVNTGLVLGLCLVSRHARRDAGWMRDHGFLMIMACILTYVLALRGQLALMSGSLLLFACACYTAWSILTAARNPERGRQSAEAAMNLASYRLPSGSLAHQLTVVLLLFGFGILSVLLSSRMILSSAIEIAAFWGISESVIALTLVAGGTSLPELATALAALRRGHHDISLGIVLGSNIYNVLGVVGLGAVVGYLPVTAANQLLDFPVMLLVLVLPLLPTLWGRLPGRRTGFALLALYGAYTYSLFTLHGVFGG